VRILLDTHLLIWTKTEPRRLSREARAYIEDLTNNLYFSAASIWEISIKRALGRSDFDIHPSRLYNILLDDGYTELPVSSIHSFGVITLPLIHKDPFDRILIAQASHEGCLFLTSDAALADYPGPIRLV
jgi:PIN domain nuclease of toxin-antitoxin system